MNFNDRRIRPENANSLKYRTPRTAFPRRWNDIVINSHNTESHESKKFRICYRIKKQGHVFITEAERVCDGRIIDVINLNTGEEFEIVETNDSPKVIEKYKKEGVNIIY